MNAMHYAVLGVAIAANGCACSAQEAPDISRLPGDEQVSFYLAPAGDTGAGKTPGEFSRGSAPSAAGGVILAMPVKSRRVADSKFFLLNGIQLGTAIFDVEMTQRCIASHHCQEGNFLMPSSQAGQLSVNLTLAVCSSGISYWLKKRRSRLWWLPPVAGAAAHSAGVATGFEHQ